MTYAFDKWVIHFADFLARQTAGDGRLASAGTRVAGIRVTSSLPSESRKIRANRPLSKAVRQSESAAISGVFKGITLAVPKCTDPQYCWMHGHPCACCGGSDAKCPPGTAAGQYWSYCCNKKQIFFRDCCGNRTCPSGCPWCSNSNQPNWCGGAGNNQYVCTLAEQHGAC